MTPISEYASADDTPLDSYLNCLPIDEESFEYLSVSSTQTEEDLDDSLDIDLASLMGMSDADLMNKVWPDSLGLDEPWTVELEIANYTNQVSAMEDRIPSDQSSAKTKLPADNVDEMASAVKLKPKTNQRRRPSASQKQAKKQRRRRTGNRSIHLWEFLKEMLNNSEQNENYIKWISKAEGVFQLVNSSGVAKLWGQRKNRKNMTYEKMSRALRYYYEKDILERVPNARLIYKFGGKTRLIATENESLSDSSEN